MDTLYYGCLLLYNVDVGDNMYHISDVKKYNRCPKLFWLSIKEEQEPYNSFVRIDEALTDLAIEKLKISDYFLGKKNDAKELALEALDSYEWLVKARFEYNQLRIKIPFLHRINDNYDVYFLYCGNYPKEDDIQFYVDNIWVLTKNNIKINDIYIIHFNANYVRGDELNVDELFEISKTFFNSSGNPTRPLISVINNKMVDLQPVLDEMDNIIKLDYVESIRTNKCTRRIKCSKYDSCFPNEKEINPDSILTLVSSQHKYKMNENGIESLKDADLSLIEGTRAQYAQIRASQNGGLFVDKYSLITWMEQFKGPLAFVDFEWETYAVPQYKGLKCFDVICFQYSIHILKEDGSISHSEYIGTKDCREEFIQHLIDDIPSNATVVAFNAEGAEKLRLNELASQFPQYQETLFDINSRMVDLAFPFSVGLVYDTRMRGYYSLKVLLSVVDENLSYADIDIHHGMDAVYSWRKIDKDQAEDVNKIKKTLLEYCGLDSYAMIVVYRWLKKLIVKDC